MDKEFKVSVYDFTKTQSPQGRTSDDGTGAADLRAIMEENWDRYEKIVVVLDGIVRMSRVFIDEAFAKLLENHSLDEFNNKIFFPDAKEELKSEIVFPIGDITPRPVTTTLLFKFKNCYCILLIYHNIIRYAFCDRYCQK